MPNFVIFSSFDVVFKHVCISSFARGYPGAARNWFGCRCVRVCGMRVCVCVCVCHLELHVFLGDRTRKPAEGEDQQAYEELKRSCLTRWGLPPERES